MLKEIGISVYLLILSYFDLKEKQVPCMFLAAGALAMLLGSGAGCIWGTMDWKEVLKGGIPGALLLLTAVLTEKAGRADGIVLLCIGMLEGFSYSFVLFCGSLLLLTFWAITLILLHKANMNSKIPYLPFVCCVYLFTYFGHCFVS